MDSSFVCSCSILDYYVVNNGVYVMDKFCLVCGKPLRKNTWGVFCSRNCSAKGIVDASKYRIKREIRIAKDFIEKYIKVSGCDFSRRDKITTLHKRLVCYSLVKIFNISTVSSGKVLKMDHTTVIHHVKKISENEKVIAQHFVDHNILDLEKKVEKPISEFEQNVIRLGFSYKTKGERK